MKNLKTYILALTFASMAFGCADKLDVVNPNNQTAADFWTTENSIAEGVIGIYNRLIVDGYYARMTPSLIDVRGDDVWSESPWTIYPLSGDFTVLNDYDVLTWLWREYFMQVYRANIVLKYIDDINFTDNDYKNRLKGQALFLRALAYYNIAENYETAPLLRAVPNGEDEFYPTSANYSNLLNFMVEDLVQAVDMLPLSYNNVNGADKGQLGRATKGSARALLARVYMIQNDWANAEKLLSDIIESKVYSLVDNYADNFGYQNENNSESVFEIQFGNFGTDENWWSYSTTNWRQGHALGFNYGITAFGAWGDLKPTTWLYNEFKKELTTDGQLDPRLYSTIVSYEPEYDTYTDGRNNTIFGRDAYRDTNALGRTTLQAGNIFIAKYTYSRINGHTLEQDGERLGNVINYRLIRYAEVLLNYAETLYELGRYNEVYEPLNQVRKRAKLASITEGSLSNTDLYNEIVHQRVLELSVECIRHFDIKRWGWFYNNDRLQELISHDDEFATWKQGHEYLPIPSTELAINPNLGQNSAN